MNQKTQRTLEQLNKDLFRLLEELKNYSEADLNRPPKPGSWSALQTMHHLMLSEKVSQAYVAKKLSFNPALKRSGLLSGLRYRALAITLKTPLKWKAPEAIGDNAIPEKSSFWELVKQWKTQRESLRGFLEELPEEYFSKEIYKHPAVGRMSLEHMICFFQIHFKHHRKQIRRALIFPPERSR